MKIQPMNLKYPATLILLLFMIFPERGFAQQTGAGNAVLRTVKDRGGSGLDVTYHFGDFRLLPEIHQGTLFHVPVLEHFTFLKDIGRPALPVHYDVVILNEGSDPALTFETGKAQILSPVLVRPAFAPATDRHGDPEPGFVIDSAFYKTQGPWPSSAVSVVGVLKIRGIRLAIIQICPFSYNPADRKLLFYSSLSYKIRFDKKAPFLSDLGSFSASFLSRLPNLALNGSGFSREIKGSKPVHIPKSSPLPVNYLIITHSNYRQAADSMAKWKAQLGYSVEVISRSSWTSSQVKAEIHGRYASLLPRPDYFVIIGDHDKVPGEIHQDPSYGDNFATDLYYACMDGPGDYVADMAFGRISVSTLTEAMNVVNKIISYEKNPPASAAFYSSATVCAQFQDDDNDKYEDRRFTLTSEEVRNYLTTKGFSVDRVYRASASDTPGYYNNGYYANSEPIPSSLLRPGFAWDGDKYDIAAALNSASGRLLIMHRDHGYVGGSGWSTPEFVTSDIGLLNNGNRLPVVLSINCHTGEYQLPECFAEKFLRASNGGAVGVFAAAYYSYSGFNDGLADAMIDAIWSQPGLIPNFTGNGQNPVGSPQAHQDIVTMGDVMNQGLIRMVQTWGDDIYTHELFHYFGDPAMRIWTSPPQTLTATHSSVLSCGDTVFQVYSASCPDALATLVVDGHLVASVQLSGGTGTLNFAPIYGNEAFLTLSKHNFRPYIYRIPFTSQCLRAGFTETFSNPCTGQPILFTDASIGSITARNWNFGQDASPPTAVSQGPHTVTYLSPGNKTICLTVTDGQGSSTFCDTIFITQPCTWSMQQNTKLNLQACQGSILDNGGGQSYLPGSSDTLVLTAAGASFLSLYFTDFDVEQGSGTDCDYDFLEVYDGPSTTAPLLGKYCNTPGHLPPASLNTSGNSATFRFYSDAYTEGRGYIIDFNCSTPGQAPVAAFSANPLSSCTGLIQFSDQSTNVPSSWFWDFGDGQFSALQNPQHQYSTNGFYTVKLTAQNLNGSSSFTRISYISNEMPPAPIVYDTLLCSPATPQLTAQASGSIRWYDQPWGGNVLSTGPVFLPGTLLHDTVFYAENLNQPVLTAGAPDTNIGNGSFYNAGTSHYLKFDCYQALTLKSFDVYARTTANRNFRIETPNQQVLFDTTVLCNPGLNTIIVNKTLATGSQYRLVANGSPVNYLYRNTSGAAFPYMIPGLFSITGNSYSNPAYYYFFYNIKIQGPACISPRSALNVVVSQSAPQAAFTLSLNQSTVNLSNLSQYANQYLWNFGDGQTSTAQNPSHTYSSNGMFIIQLQAGNGCGNSLATDTVYITTVGTAENLQSPLCKLVPNPARDEVSLVWSSKDTGPQKVEIYASDGRLLYSHKPGILPETGSMQLPVRSFCPGLYWIKAEFGNRSLHYKLIIIK